MKRFGFLFRPQWLALYVVVAAFAWLCFTVLAPWQLGKNTTTSRENTQIANSLNTDPVPLTNYLPQQDSSAYEHQWQRVTASGHYLPEAQVLARLRSVDGAPAYEVLVPFVVDGGPTVLVNRGYVKPDQGTAVPTIAPAPVEPVTITGRLRDSEMLAVGREPFRAEGAMQVYSINPGQVSQVTGVPLTGSYLQLVEDQPGGLGVIPLPVLDAGPFLSYGIQWIAFGIIAPIGVGYFILAEVKVRRREKALANPQKDSEPETTAPKPVSTEQKLADRYGKRH
ncbi:SURF1 family cytochrome oxidase biogenesis protein [Mycolicibacterium frederiksbergense]|uniref:SURF1-like protein n=1 Tax=Mycolicibacterium frederiksbergense TaxID=117567 RepID=A0A6H0SBT3_9MYCO|nr:SURF1 family protein [Mycolicibacterium frederiksbergense]QIV84041.1 SURF1 family protein [Mycolicibacterium frederiksbergense]